MAGGSRTNRAADRAMRGLGAERVHDEDFEELRRHWDDDRVVEIIAAISTLGFFNRWNDTLATGLEPLPLLFAEEHLSDAGWNVGKHAAG